MRGRAGPYPRLMPPSRGASVSAMRSRAAAQMRAPQSVAKSRLKRSTVMPPKRPSLAAARKPFDEAVEARTAAALRAIGVSLASGRWH